MAKIIVSGAVLVCLLVCYLNSAQAIICFENGVEKDGCQVCQKDVVYVSGVTISATYKCAQTCKENEAFGGLVKTGTATYCCPNNRCNGAGALRTNLLSGLVLAAAALWLLRI